MEGQSITISRSTSTKMKKVWKEKGSTHDKKKKQSNSSHKHGGSSVMTWTCIPAFLTGSLILIDVDNDQQQNEFTSLDNNSKKD